MLWLAFGKDHHTLHISFLLCWPVSLPTQQRQHSPNVLRLAKPPQFFVKESFTEAKASTREEPKPYRSCAHRRSAAGPTMGDGFAGEGAVPPVHGLHKEQESAFLAWILRIFGPRWVEPGSYEGG
jgi:hypothetical protein